MKKGFGVVLLIISIGLIGLGTYYLFQDKEFTVKFTGTDNIADVVVKKDSYVKRPTDPIKIGYKFIGWYNNGTLFDFNSKITQDITLEAKWEKLKANDTTTKDQDEYTVTFKDDDGKIVDTIKVKKGGVVTKPADPVKEEYKFVGWYNDSVLYDFNLEVTKDLILTAKFEKIVKYTVTFDSEGGSKVASVTVESGKKVSKPTNPTKSGYTFKSWQLNGSDYDFSKEVTKNITLKATWNKNVVKYTVKFNSNGGTAVSSKTVESGKTVSKPTNPTRTGYTFVSWQLNGKDYNFSSKVTSNITLTAKWRVNPTYTVTFDVNGGSALSSKTIIGGTKVDKPTNPTKAGYTFVEWQLNGKKYDFNSLVTSNITLKAVWEEEK